MRRDIFSSSLSSLMVCLLVQGCSKSPSPEESKQAAELRQQLAQVRQDIDGAKKDSSQYSGGLLKSLNAVRLEVLATNAALLDQRINALESGARITVTVQATQLNPTQAGAIAKEIVAQTSKLADAKAESARYDGGLVKSMAEMAVATNLSSLAMLQQQYLIAQYGIALPTGQGSSTAVVAAPAAATTTASAAIAPKTERSTTAATKSCVRIDTYDSSVLSSNEVFVELAWKADIANSCDVPAQVRVTFVIFDKDDFELDSDSKSLLIGAHDVGNARGKMLVSPLEKAHRMTKQGVSMKIL